MSEIKRISIREFRELGFLQEANRQFFHPHGLALEVMTCTESDEAPAPLYALALPAAQYERLVEIVGDQDTDLAERLRTANRYEVGDSYLSGVWDYRDDPEGILYGLGGYGDSAERAQRVREERMRHYYTRLELFGSGVDPDYPHILEGPDVEPLDWTAE